MYGSQGDSNIIVMIKSLRTSQNGTKHVKTCNLTHQQHNSH